MITRRQVLKTGAAMLAGGGRIRRAPRCFRCGESGSRNAAPDTCAAWPELRAGGHASTAARCRGRWTTG